MIEPRVSVIVGVRDGEAYLAQALDSIASQGVEPLEVIVVDDGSRDGTAAIARRHPLRPRVVSQPEPLGVGAALNRGIGLARGRYLAFLDHDDVWPSGRLPAMLAAIDDGALDFVYGLVANTDERLEPLAAPQPGRLMGSWIIRREAAARVGAFRTDVVHAAVLDWTSRVEAAGLTGRAIDRLVLLRRIHGGNLGIRGRDAARGDLLRVVRDHHRRRQA